MGRTEVPMAQSRGLPTNLPNEDLRPLNLRPSNERLSSDDDREYYIAMHELNLELGRSEWEGIPSAWVYALKKGNNFPVAPTGSYVKE